MSRDGRLLIDYNQPRELVQMVFRKLVEVQREKELAERRKDDPPLDVTQDLAVRKLLSRLQRRTNENHRASLPVSSQADLKRLDDGSAPRMRHSRSQ